MYSTVYLFTLLGITQLSVLKIFPFNTPKEFYTIRNFVLYKSYAIFIQEHILRAASRLQNSSVPVSIMRYMVLYTQQHTMYKPVHSLSCWKISRGVAPAPSRSASYKCGKLFYGFRLKIALNTELPSFHAPGMLQSMPHFPPSPLLLRAMLYSSMATWETQ